jgi:rSAM/selenodomain-associated transferase 1
VTPLPPPARPGPAGRAGGSPIRAAAARTGTAPDAAELTASARLGTATGAAELTASARPGTAPDAARLAAGAAGRARLGTASGAAGLTATAADCAGLASTGELEGTLAGQILVIAKEPVPGRVKTRLTPPFSPEQAARLAAAALADTLAAAAGAAAARLVIALEGAPGRWLPAGLPVLAQRGGGLDERIAAAMADAYAGLARPVVLIGMDTPQVTPALLEAALRPLADGAADATFGPAADGGFWLLGLRRPDPRLILGVPMSTAGTGAAQLARLHDAGLRVRRLPPLLDVDTAADAYAVARLAPRTRFAAALAAMTSTPAPPNQPPASAARPSAQPARLSAPAAGVGS